MKNINISDFYNYLVRVLIIIIWIYLYFVGSITISRIFSFIIVVLLIIGYSRIAGFIMDFFNNKKVIKYIEINNVLFRKIIYILLEVHKWVNSLIVFLVYTDKCLYKIVRYISGTKWINYNFVIYLLIKYLIMFGLVKYIVYKYYNFLYKLDQYSIIEILFKRMYGLILSILIFTDIFNNIISYLSHYGIWVYILIYYIISILCVMWELLNFYYLESISNYIEKYKDSIYFKYIIRFLLYVTRKIDYHLQNFTKTNVIIFLRSQYTWLGQTIIGILEIITPRVVKETNFKDTYMSIEKFSETQFMTSGRIAYYRPQKNRIPFKYFYYIGSLMNIGYFDATYRLYWESFKNDLSYKSFFKSIREIKGKPSIFIYIQLQELARLYDVHNQPINRLMDWNYFEIKLKESLNLLNESEKSIASKNLLYFNKVDKLRAKLMFFIIWDIESYYNENKKEYNWDYWIIQEHSILDISIFQMDDRFDLKLNPNNKLLKFYDPEENMEYFNRLFNVLGIINNVYLVDANNNTIDDVSYYVSEKFNNYNEKYVELMKIMYSYDFTRCYEKRCECTTFAFCEVEIAYKTEDYMRELRKEWEGNITEELAHRNWRLLIELEEAMVKA